MADTPDKSALEQRIQENIFGKALEATRSGIYAEIEEEKDKVRHGEGFWGAVKAFFFMIAEALGIEKWLSRLMGSPIPEDQDINKVSTSVANTVSNTLTDKNFKYANKQEFEEGLQEKILKDLPVTDSFDAVRLNRIASEAAKKVSAEFSGLFDENGKVKAGANLFQSPVNKLAVAKLADKMEALNPEQKQQLAALAGKPALEKTDIEIIARAVGPKLAELDTKINNNTAFSIVADELRKTLIDRRNEINTVSGMKLTNAGLTALADQISLSFVRDKLGDKIEVSAAFKHDMEGHKRKAINEAVTAKVTTEVEENIKNVTALNFYAAGKASDLKSLGAWWAAKGADIAVMDQSYENDGGGKEAKNYHLKKDLTPEQLDKLHKAQVNLHKAAAGWHRSLSDTNIKIDNKDTNQVKEASKIVADAVTETINDPKNKELNKDALANKLEMAIAQRLQENKQAINAAAPGNTIDAINKKNERDIFADIAKGFADTIRNNEGGAYTLLRKAQKALITSLDLPNGKNIADIKYDKNAATPANGHFVGAARLTPANAVPSTQYQIT